MREERRLRAAVAANPKLASDGSAWDDIAHIQGMRAHLFTRQEAMSNISFESRLLRQAIRLVRASAERAKPNGERLPEYTDQALVNLQQQISSPIPV